MDNNLEGYIDLAHAIVLQAYKDYAATLRRIIHPKDDEVLEKARKEKTAIESFFSSGEYEMYTEISPVLLIHRAKEKTGFSETERMMDLEGQCDRN